MAIKRQDPQHLWGNVVFALMVGLVLVQTGSLRLEYR